MKIKCIATKENYLTVGKIYEIAEPNGTDAGWMIDDEGDVIYVYMKMSSHGEFEEVEE